MNLRLTAARVIDAITDGQSLSDVLPQTLKNLKDPRDRAFVQAVCYGVCRYYTRLDVVLSELLQKPMHAKDSDVHALLMVGLYQLMEMRVPPHAAVDQTVRGVEELDKPWARGLVNAVLREYLRKEAKLREVIQSDVESLYAHPRWWVDQIKKSWPNQGSDILNANNEHPPFSLRVNLSKWSREDYLEKLIAANMAASIIPETKAGIVLAEPVSVESLPYFAQGAVSVQDGAAMLAAELLQLKPGLRVLDACAAPGGKLTHILETEPDLAEVVAVEKDSERMLSIKENFSRLKLDARCVCADANETDAFFDGTFYDRILLDAPCSASGVIRRHPDIKLLRQPEDIQPLIAEQEKLLKSLWPLLSPGGLFVYATCSVFKGENESVVKRFLATHSDASEEVIEADWGVACAVGRQILPGMHGMDGFYYACLRKRS